MNSNENKPEENLRDEHAKRGEWCGHGRQHGGRCGGGKKRWMKVPFIILAVGLLIAAKSAVVMWLWNDLIADAFHGPMLSYLQSFELVVLVKLLTGFPGRGFGGGFGRFGGRHRDHHRHFRRARWEAMSEEERQKFRETVRKQHDDLP